MAGALGGLNFFLLVLGTFLLSQKFSVRDSELATRKIVFDEMLNGHSA